LALMLAPVTLGIVDPPSRGFSLISDGDLIVLFHLLAAVPLLFIAFVTGLFAVKHRHYVLWWLLPLGVVMGGVVTWFLGSM